MNPEMNRIFPGDCRAVMAGWPESCIDTILTDPPYGLGFMGKGWDHAVPGVDFWAEMLRVAKPGAMLLAFGGTRTWHRMAVAIEDAGWEIRDSLMWLYGSGFPKSLDISKAIDKAAGVKFQATPAAGVGFMNPDGQGGYNVTKNQLHRCGESTDLARQWSGWGTALKPAWEPIILAMKPIDGTFAENAQKWGVAGLNIDGGRIGGNPGRWPANLLLDEDAAAMLDGQAGVLSSGDPAGVRSGGQGNAFGEFAGGYPVTGFGDSGGASRFFYVAKADRRERNEGCEGLPERRLDWSSGTQNPGSFQAEGTNRQAQNFHPTVKPLDLMKYLCNLTRTPTGGIVLDPFCGSGTTLWAAECHNRPWIGIELNPEYAAIAEKRIANERAQIKMAV